MTLLARLARPATKAAGVPSISDDGTYVVAPSFAWLASIVGRTLSGAAVTEEGSLALPTLYACVRVLAESVASLPLIVYRRLPNGGKERFTDHPMYPVLHDQPNPEMTSFAWRETKMTHLGTWGNSFNEVLEDGFGRKEIWPLPPSRFEVGFENGRKVYDYLRLNGTRKRMRDGTILHIPGLSMNGLVGMSPVATHRETLGEMTATRNFGQSFYRNMARPATILEHPGGLSAGAIERLAKQAEEMRGSGNAGKTLVLEEGMKVHEIGVPPEDAQYIETRKLQREDVCQMYRMQPHMVGILDHGTYANVEQESINFVVNTLRPWLVRLEQSINVFFFADEPDVFAEFLIDGLLRGDAKTRADSLMVQRQAGVLTKHEWQAIENRNPSGDDDIWVPIANHEAVPIDAAGMPIQEPVVEPPVPDLSIPDGTQPPQLVRVKSVTNLRCEGRLATGEVCGKLLAEVTTPPYRHTCTRCKTVAESGGDAEAASPVDVLERMATKHADALSEMAAAFASRPITVDARMEPGAVVVHPAAITVQTAGSTRKTVQRNRTGQITSVIEEPV